MRKQDRDSHTPENFINPRRPPVLGSNAIRSCAIAFPTTTIRTKFPFSSPSLLRYMLNSQKHELHSITYRKHSVRAFLWVCRQQVYTFVALLTNWKDRENCNWSRSLKGDNIWLLWPQTDSSNELITNMCPRTDCNNILMLNTFFTMEAFWLQDGLVMLTHINKDILFPWAGIIFAGIFRNPVD